MTTNKRWWEEGLRQEFQDFADSIIWSNDEGDEKYIGVGNMADWWVEKIKIIESQAYQRAVEEVGKSKDDAYHERDMLVCALSKLFPSYLARHDEKEEWEDDWRWIVYIEIPTGQVSWHIHDSEIEMFVHLEVKENNWDGHNTERKYQRLSKLQALKGEEAIKTGYIGELAGYRIHGKTFDTEGNKVEETHEKDCACCRSNLLGNKGEEIK